MAHGSPTVFRRRLVTELRRRRDALGLSGPRVAQELGWSTSKISRLEKGQIVPGAKDVQALLDLYEMPEPGRSRLLGLVPLASAPEWWEKYSDAIAESYASLLGFESGAEERWEWQSLVLPGRLQTEEYARAIIGNGVFGELSPRQVKRLVELRMERKNRLRNDALLTSRVIVDESVLSRRIGDGAVMREQMRHLRELAGENGLDLQVLLHSRGLPAPVPCFVLLRFPVVEGLGELYPDVLYVEDEVGGRLDEDEMRAHRYLVVFEKFSKVALDPRESVRLIEEWERKWAV
ncbi:helix-turn-helix domain-containing protein [Nonomuraea sp. NPDC050783]|uniref:helix-turn-helix domain-containing protein n=1 Tax=Nonomuraea sp. NPDC050783 TaxID=3154634 RepID=UPI003464F467